MGACRNIRSQYPYAKEALIASTLCSYWVSASRRILSQFVVWEDVVGREALAGGKTPPEQRSRRLGAILPLLVTSGTVTRRAVEPTWLTGL